MERKRRPTSKIEIQLGRLEQAVASQAIEGNPLTDEEVTIFEECILQGYPFEKRAAILREHFPNYDGVMTQ